LLICQPIILSQATATPSCFIPSYVKESLLVLDAQYATYFTGFVQNFKFEKGNTDDFVCERFATIKHGDKIDIAYLVYTVDFKLSPIVTEYVKKRNPWGYRSQFLVRQKKKVYLSNTSFTKKLRNFAPNLRA
jgi:hypothetical protein